MLFSYEMNIVMLIDGIVFIISGVNLMLFPSPQRKLNVKVDSKTALPAFKDVRSALGASYLSMGVIMTTLSFVINNPNELDQLAKYRAISLVFIIYASVMQRLRKKWKWRGEIVLYFGFHITLFLIYLFLGFIDPHVNISWFY